MLAIATIMQIIESFLFSLGCSIFVKPKYGKYTHLIMSFSGIIAVFLASVLTEEEMWYPSITRTVLSLTIITAASFLFFKGKKFYIILALGLSFLLQCFVDLIILNVSYFYDPNFTNVAYISESLHGKVFLKFLALLLYFLLLCTSYKMKNYINVKGSKFEDVKYFALIPLSQAITFTVSVVGMTSYSIKMASFIGVIIIIISIIADITLFNAIKKFKLLRIKEERALFYEEQLEQQIEHYKDFLDYNQKLSELRHDMKHQMQTIQVLIGQNDLVLAEKVAKDVIEYTEDLQVISYCSNNTLNALLFKKNSEMNESSIAFQCQLKMPVSAEIENMDICRILSNVLDNAITSCDKVLGERYISLKSEILKNVLIITCKNSKNEELKTDLKSSDLITTKEDEGHGLGLTIIKGIAEKYNGKVKLNYDDSKFEIKIFLMICRLM